MESKILFYRKNIFIQKKINDSQTIIHTTGNCHIATVTFSNCRKKSCYR